MDYYKNLYIKFLITFLKITKRNRIFPAGIFNMMTSKSAQAIFNSKLFFPFWSVFLLLKNWRGLNIKRNKSEIKYYNDGK